MNKYKFLYFLYNNRAGIALRRHIITKPMLSRLAGRLADTYMSKFFIKLFIKKYNIDMNEAIRSSPNNYTSLNDFFTRKLKPAARPIDKNSATIISPADGTLHAIENIGSHTKLFVKGKIFDIKKFLGSKKQANQFNSGTLVTIYLAPYNYHRFHFPSDGVSYKTKQISGVYESVQPITYNSGIQPLIENERRVNIIQTKDCGTIALVSVGALCIGRITETYKPGQPYLKGDEIGYFSFGGSTLVLFFEKNRISLDSTFKTQLMQSNTGISVKMGQKIGTKIDPE